MCAFCAQNWVQNQPKPDKRNRLDVPCFLACSCFLLFRVAREIGQTNRRARDDKCLVKQHYERAIRDLREARARLASLEQEGSCAFPQSGQSDLSGELVGAGSSDCSHLLSPRLFAEGSSPLLLYWSRVVGYTLPISSSRRKAL